jgi:hypothetical protein
MLNGVTVIDSSFGIDIGGDSADNVIGIAIYNVKMENVSSPFLLKDTTFTYPRNNYDTIEVLIDGVSCRNCGDASDIGTTGVNSVDGGIIVCDRAYGVTIRNMQVVNDTGLSGTTAYPGVGGLVRGTVKSLILDDVLFVTTTSTAVFNFNYQAITPAATYDIDSYVNSKNVRVHANLDYVVSTKSGATIGAAEMSVELGSTGASLAGIVDANAGALSTAMLQVIDRDQTYYSTGYRKLSAIYNAGNQLTGVNACIGAPVSASPTRSWTPVVTSTSGTITTVGNVVGKYSVVGDLVFAFFDVTITTNGTGSGSIQIAGLPIASSVSSTSGSGVEKVSNKALQLEHSGDLQFLTRFYDGTYAGADNANFVGCYIYTQG